MEPDDLSFAWRIAQDFGLDVLSVNFIAGGFSEDRKYRIQARDRTYLVRLSDGKREAERRLEFESLVALRGQGIPCSEPFHFGTTPDRCFALYSYIEGECAETALPLLPEPEQKDVGLRAGRILRQIHEAIPKKCRIDESELRGAKFSRHREMLYGSGISYRGQGTAESFVEAQLGLLRNRPITFRHGDFHPSNLILGEGGQVGVIDFNRCDFGDPYDDFYKTAYFGAPLSALYGVGLVTGYFGGEPPLDFWPIYNVYVAAVLPSDIVWAQKLFPTLIQEAIDRVEWITSSHDFENGGPPDWWLAQSD